MLSSLDAKEDLQADRLRSSRVINLGCKLGVLSELDKKKLIAPFSSRSPLGMKEIESRGTALHSMLTTRSPDSRTAGTNLKISDSLGLCSPRFPKAHDLELVGSSLPIIDSVGLDKCQLEKKGFGDLIVECGKVTLDFWRRKLRVTIKGECVTVEQPDAKKQLYSRRDLPKKFHNLYLFASKMTEVLRQRQKPIQCHEDNQVRYSEARMTPEEILGALSSAKRKVNQ